MSFGFRWRVSAGILVFVMTSLAFGDDRLGDLEEQVKALQKQQDEMLLQETSNKGKIKSFLQDDVSLGGFFENGFSGVFGPDTKTQFSTAQNELGVNLAATLGENFRFSSQVIFFLIVPLQNQDNDPRGPLIGLPATREFSGGTIGSLLPQAYLEYGSSAEFSFQAGLGYVPFGIAFQTREPVLFRRRNGPQMLTASGGDGVVIVPAVWSGVHLTGTSRFGANHWGWDAYTLTPASNVRTVGGGGRGWIDLSSHVTVGLSSQIAKRVGDTYEAVGTDLKLRFDSFGTDVEFATNVTSQNNPWSFYVEPFYSFFDGKFLIYLTADYLNNPVAQTIGLLGTLDDPLQRWVYGGGVNWLPLSYTRFRLGFLMNDYVGSTSVVDGVRRDYSSLDLSVGVEF